MTMDNHDASVIIENGPNNFVQFQFKIEQHQQQWYRSTPARHTTILLVLVGISDAGGRTADGGKPPFLDFLEASSRSCCFLVIAGVLASSNSTQLLLLLMPPTREHHRNYE